MKRKISETRLKQKIREILIEKKISKKSLQKTIPDYFNAENFELYEKGLIVKALVKTSAMPTQNQSNFYLKPKASKDAIKNFKNFLKPRDYDKKFKSGTGEMVDYKIVNDFILSIDFSIYKPEISNAATLKKKMMWLIEKASDPNELNLRNLRAEYEEARRVSEPADRPSRNVPQGDMTGQNYDILDPDSDQLMRAQEEEYQGSQRAIANRQTFLDASKAYIEKVDGITNNQIYENAMQFAQFELTDPDYNPELKELVLKLDSAYSIAYDLCRAFNDYQNQIANIPYKDIMKSVVGQSSKIVGKEDNLTPYLEMFKDGVQKVKDSPLEKDLKFGDTQNIITLKDHGDIFSMETIRDPSKFNPENFLRASEDIYQSLTRTDKRASYTNLPSGQHAAFQPSRDVDLVFDDLIMNYENITTKITDNENILNMFPQIVFMDGEIETLKADLVGIKLDLTDTGDDPEGYQETEYNTTYIPLDKNGLSDKRKRAGLIGLTDDGTKVYTNSMPSKSRPDTSSRKGKPHKGVDFAAKQGRYIYAVLGGTVISKSSATSDPNNGNGIFIKDSNGGVHGYIHMSAHASRLSVGSTVKAGQFIGQVGSTGAAEGNHLHYSYRKPGSSENETDPKVYRALFKGAKVHDKANQTIKENLKVIKKSDIRKLIKEMLYKNQS